MAITSAISSFELQRVGRRAYEGKTARVFLCDLTTEPYDEQTPVPLWRNIELPEITGYLPAASVLGAGTYDAVDARYELPTFDSTFIASGGTITWNTVVVYIDEPQLETESVTGTDIAFDDVANTITQGTVDFAAEGFIVGDVVVVSGSASNDGNYEITGVTATTLTLESTRTQLPLAEVAGATVTLQRANIYPYSVLTETPNASLADQQAYTYRIGLNTNDA